MAISGDYPRPIIVNGFQCRNCDEVSDAKRNIDPAASKSDLEGPAVGKSGGFAEQSYTLGGSLAGRVLGVTATMDSASTGRSLDRFA